MNSHEIPIIVNNYLFCRFFYNNSPDFLFDVCLFIKVVWECPIELLQYRQSLVTRPPPLPPPPPTASAGGGGLVAGYGSDSEADGEEEEGDEGEKKGKEKPAEEIEKDPEFIGPKMPKTEVRFLEIIYIV